MTDFERFVEWIRREAAFYNEPPETPTALIWGELETALKVENVVRNSGRGEDLSPESGARAEGIAEEVGFPAGVRYHDPPEAPRERMWQRIEASLLLRQSAPPGAREAGLPELAEVEALFDVDGELDVDGKEEPRRRSVALWLTGAVAASILFGFMIGRGLPQLDPASPQVATQPVRVGVPIELAVGVPLEENAEENADENADEDTNVDANGFASTVPPLEPLETGLGFAVAGATRPISTAPTVDTGRGGARAETGPDGARAEPSPDRRQVVARYATNVHLGRTETLLAAFRAGDAEPEQMSDVARAARNLLGETRLLLDMSVTRPERERALLEEIELLLAQIARLGPDAPAFERDIVAEGLERLGTVASLRELAPQVGM